MLFFQENTDWIDILEYLFGILCFAAGFLLAAAVNKLAIFFSKTKDRITEVILQIFSAVFFVLAYIKYGISIELLVICLLTLILIMISYIDFTTYEIPIVLNGVIFALGVVVSIVDFDNILSHIIGMFAIGLPLYILILITDGRAMGGGDFKLMVAAGLLIGWKLVVLAFFLGCIFASVIHSIRIKVSDESHRLAFGPYLALGIMVAVLYGMDMISWYFSLI